MTTCIIAEKPSVARDIARIVGATTKQDGYLAGSGYLVTWAMGHLITLAMPEAYGYSNYKAEELPICPNPFQLIVRQVRKDKEVQELPRQYSRTSGGLAKGTRGGTQPCTTPCLSIYMTDVCVSLSLCPHTSKRESIPIMYASYVAFGSKSPSQIIP